MMTLRQCLMAYAKLERNERNDLDELTDKDKQAMRINNLKLKHFNKKTTPYMFPVMLYYKIKTYKIKYELNDILNIIKSDVMKIESDFIKNEINDDEKRLQIFLDMQKTFTPCGIFYGRKSRIDIRHLNGIIMLENFNEYLSFEQVEIIKSDKYTFAFFKQLERKKFIILVKTSGMTTKNYESYRLKIKEYYQTLLNNKDIFTSFINRAICLSYDKELFWNTKCNYFNI